MSDYHPARLRVGRHLLGLGEEEEAEMVKRSKKYEKFK